MKAIISQRGRSIVVTLFLAVMVAGPLCAAGGVIISSLRANNLVSLIATALFLA
jgi:hypothetical protein